MRRDSEEARPSELRNVREALGLTVKEFARGLNIAAYTIERWEDGANSPMGIQEVVYEAFETIVARVPPERALAIGEDLRLGFGSMIVHLLLKDATPVREVRKPELNVASLARLDALPERGGYATAKARREQMERVTGKPSKKKRRNNAR
jgi:transcriptional regulator with XRE-family HTH domain